MLRDVDWLKWEGWDGVSGVLALIALIVALIVTYVELRAWYLAPDEVDLDIRISRDSAPSTERGQITLRYSFRVTGTNTLYDIQALRNGGSAGAEKLGEWAALDVRDGFVESTTSVPESQKPYYFITTWRKKTRLGRRAEATRFAWFNDSPMERWRRYRWPFWPRKTAGRWVKEKPKRVRGLRGMYVPPGYDH